MTKNVMNIQEPSGEFNKALNRDQNVFDHVVFNLPFRGYFLLASLFAVINLSLWLGNLNGLFAFNSKGLTPVIWHIHEMIFAFGSTIAVAFILTAAQTWTGKRSLHGKSLTYFIFTWLAIRVALYINSEHSLYFAVLLTILWWLMAVFVYANLVISSRNRRNYLFIPMLLLMAVMNVSILYAELTNNTALALHLSRSMILVFILLMGLIGGRVIPFFTVRGAQTKDIKAPLWLTPFIIFVSLLGLTVFVLSYFVSLPLKPAPIMITAGVLHLIRLSYWRSFKTIRVPLLWSLHLAYFFMAFGLVLLGLSYYQVGISFSDSLHLINIGAISLMILSMMSRVSLGHTGKPLVIKKLVHLAFISMLLAALIRTFLPYAVNELPLIIFNFIHNPILLSWNVSATLWGVSMLIFVFKYWPILTKNTKN